MPQNLFFLLNRFFLADSLLMSNSIFQTALLQIRSLCEDACSSGSGKSNEEDKITLLETEWYNTMVLGAFCERQRSRVVSSSKKLAALRKKVVEIVTGACEVGVKQRFLISMVNLVWTYAVTHDKV